MIHHQYYADGLA